MKLLKDIERGLQLGQWVLESKSEPDQLSQIKYWFVEKVQNNQEPLCMIDHYEGGIFKKSAEGMMVSQKISFLFRGTRNLVRLESYLQKAEDSSYLGIKNRMIWNLFIQIRQW